MSENNYITHKIKYWTINFTCELSICQPSAKVLCDSVQCNCMLDNAHVKYESSIYSSSRVMGNVKVFWHRHSDLKPGNDNHNSHVIRPHQLNRFHEQICKAIPSFCNSSSVLLHQEVPFIWRGVILQDSHMEIFEFPPKFCAVHRVMR